MASHHASLGRRTLEKIRHKKADEKLSKTSSGPDIAKPPSPKAAAGIPKSSSSTGISEYDISGLVSQIQHVQKRNAELDKDNRNLSSKLHSKEIENDMLVKRVNVLEQNTVPSLRKALKDVAMEKDAAVVSREDFSAQVRSLKKLLKEAEEEQYKAEEDAAALRSELNSLQHQAFYGNVGGGPQDQMQLEAIEKELADLKIQLEQESMLRRQEGILRRQEQQQFAEEKHKISTIISEKRDLEEKLSAMSHKISGKEVQFTLEQKETLEKQLHDMAVVVERLENSRQKLLYEIDSQSCEIEKLFEENSNLSSACEEATSVGVQWEIQIKDCLKQNEELRMMIDKLRTEQATMPNANHHDNISESNKEGWNEIVSLKGQLAQEQSRAETLSAQVLQLTAQLQQVMQAYNGLTRKYKPVLRKIETNLVKMKQDGSVAVHVAVQ